MHASRKILNSAIFAEHGYSPKYDLELNIQRWEKHIEPDKDIAFFINPMGEIAIRIRSDQWSPPQIDKASPWWHGKFIFTDSDKVQSWSRNISEFVLWLKEVEKIISDNDDWVNASRALRRLGGVVRVVD